MFAKSCYNICVFIFTYREFQLKREQQNLAVMQMVVVLVFVLCNCLAMISNILEAFKIEAVPLTHVSNLLVTINSSVNIFIYCTFRKRFRLELKRLIVKATQIFTTCIICSKLISKFKTTIKFKNEPPVYYTTNKETIRISYPAHIDTLPVKNSEQNKTSF